MNTTGASSALRGREFRVLLLAEAQSVAGDQLARVGISVLVFQRTSSAALTALTYALTFLPDIVAGPLLSGLADRFPRREVMMWATLSQAAVVAAMAIPGAPIVVIGALVVGEAFAQAPFKAAQTASARAILGDHDFATGQARLTTLREAGQVAGLAGAAAVVGFLGVQTALLLDAVTFLLAAFLLRWGLARRPAARGQRGSRGRLSLPPDPRRRALVAFSLLAALTVLPHGLVVPLVHEMGAPVWSVGLLLAADPLGLVLGAAMWCRRGTSAQQRTRRITPLALVCLGALMPFALHPGLVTAGALLAVSGWAAAYQILAKSAYVALLPDALTGHATGLVRTGLRAGQGISLILGGIVAELIGSAAATIALGGGLGVLGCAAAGYFLLRSQRDSEGEMVAAAAKVV